MSDNRHRATRDERAYGIPEAYSAPRDEALRDLAAEARHGGRYITDALARAITNDGIRARFAGEDGSEALAEIWRYTASPSGSQYPASGRDTTQRYATSAARIGGVDWEHSAYWQPQPLAEAVFDWPVYRAALARPARIGTAMVHYHADTGDLPWPGDYDTLTGDCHG